jgi:protein involved in polysaccharide export with SLBB domain
MIQAMTTLGLGSFPTPDSLNLMGDTAALRQFRDSIRADSVEVPEAPTELTLFGLDVFSQETSEFEPMVTGPVDERYRLGTGDALVLILTGDVERLYQLEVSREGFVVIPRVGQLFVNGLTLGQLEDLLYDRLGRLYSGVTRSPNARTKFQITVTGIRVNTVRVIGEVQRPGSYQVTATGGVLAALYEAGGPTERANFRAVHVRRGNELLATFDLYDYLLTGVVADEVALASGDVIFVPVRGPRVKIAGEVTRPAIYELKPGETLRDLLRIAGGLNPSAATDAATIDRILPPDERPEPGRTRTVLTVNLADALDSAGVDVPMLAGDSVTVFPIRGRRTLAVAIVGSVWQPGTYRLDPGMHLSDLIAVAGGLRPETYGGRAQILRTLPDSTRQLIGVVLGTPDDGSAEILEDQVLREFDEVTIFSRTEFRPERYVDVYGAVQKPGAIVFADSMTLRDAILLAGGLLDDAYLAEAEISRPGISSGDSLAVALRVPLDSSYVFDPTSYVQRPVGAPASPEVVLRPYDNVFIRRQPNWALQRTVFITGEVLFPGGYSLLSKNDRLADILSRAGGLTSQAYSNGIRFFRREENAGRIAVDLEGVLNDPDHLDNLLLAADDSIHIPPYNPTVRVEGSVLSPSSVPYARGADTDYYVASARLCSSQTGRYGKRAPARNRER